jgi:3-phenylpropionate/cinnamic acid dioxygenase small subunit
MADQLGQRVADELEIRNLISRVAHLTDSGDLADYQDYYTADAVWGEVPGSNASGGQPTTTGLAAIVAGVDQRRRAGIQGPGTHTQHIVNTVSVRFVDDDQAVARAYWQYYGTVTTTPTLLRVGTYDLLLRRTAAGWRFHRRLVGNVDAAGNVEIDPASADRAI